jgi:hypothetical protein
MRNEAPAKAFILLSGLFTGSLVISSVLAAKIVTVLGITVPAGVLGYCLTFVCTDVISEVWGRERAGEVILAGFVTLVACLGLIQAALWWPAAPFWQGQEAFRQVLGLTPRIILGSIIAYLVGQYHDIWAFHFYKRLTRGRHLWLRNNLSTVSSQLLDSCIFISIAFAGKMPLVPLILGQWAIKVGIAGLDTVLVYALVAWIRRRQAVAAVEA